MTYIAASILTLLCVAPMAWGTADPVTTSAPSGDYQTGWLRLPQGGVRPHDKRMTPTDVSVFLGLRDGKPVTVCFADLAMSGQRIVWLERSTLALGVKKLEEELIGRTNLNWGSKVVHGFGYKVDAAA